MVSGEVKSPPPRPPVCSSALLPWRRLPPAHPPPRIANCPSRRRSPETVRSQRSGSSASSPNASKLSGVRRSTENRSATAHLPPVDSRGDVDQLAKDPDPVLERAPVLVGVRSLTAGIEKLAQQIAVRGVHVDDVESGQHGAPAPPVPGDRGLPECRTFPGDGSEGAEPPTRFSTACCLRPSQAGGNPGWTPLHRATTRRRQASRARAPRPSSARARRCPPRPKETRREGLRHRTWDGPNSTRCRRPPSRPRPSSRARRPESWADANPCRCSAAPGKTGSSR